MKKKISALTVLSLLFAGLSSAGELDPGFDACFNEGIEYLELCHHLYPAPIQSFPEEPQNKRATRERLLDACIFMAVDHVRFCYNASIDEWHRTHPPLINPGGPENPPPQRPQAFMANSSPLQTNRGINAPPSVFQYQFFIPPGQSSGWKVRILNGLPGNSSTGERLNRVQGVVLLNGVEVVTSSDLNGSTFQFIYPVPVVEGDNVVEIRINKVDGPEVTNGYLTLVLLKDSE